MQLTPNIHQLKLDFEIQVNPETILQRFVTIIIIFGKKITLIDTGVKLLIGGYGILKKRNWGLLLGFCTSGIYVFGSVLVFINIVWNKDYSACLIVPALTGFMIGLSYTILNLKA